MKTTSTLTAQTANTNRGNLPEWMPLPTQNRRCPLTGLSRPTLERLALPRQENKHNPPVRSIVLRLPGNVRGRRLVHVASLMKYLDACTDRVQELAAS